METVKTTDEHIIVKKRSGRFGVQKKSGKTWVNGDDKAKVLLEHGFIKQSTAQEKPAEEAPADEEAATSEA